MQSQSDRKSRNKSFVSTNAPEFLHNGFRLRESRVGAVHVSSPGCCIYEDQPEAFDQILRNAPCLRPMRSLMIVQIGGNKNVLWVMKSDIEYERQTPIGFSPVIFLICQS